MKTYSEQLSALITSATFSLEKKIEKIGKYSEKVSHLAIDISHLRIEHSKKMELVTKEFLVDEDGNHYSFWCIDTEEFLRLVDSI